LKLILVRHGETKANEKGIYSGWTNYELTSKGKKQVEELGKILRNEEIDDILGEMEGRPPTQKSAEQQQEPADPTRSVRSALVQML